MQKSSIWKIAPGSLEYPLVVAHRGGAGVAPENTLAAFRRALEVGADAIELDVRLTRDRQVVVIHDRNLDRTTTGHGPVGTHTLEEVKCLDAGTWYGPQFSGEQVPTLVDVFEALPSNFPIYVEIKARGPGAALLATAVVNIIRRYDHRWESTMVASFNPVAMTFVRAIEPRITRGYIWSGHHPLPLRARWLSPLVQPHWLAPDRHTLTPELLSRFHSQAKPVAAWDMDVFADMRALGEIGLDAVVTDHPESLVRQKHGVTRRSHVDSQQ